MNKKSSHAITKETLATLRGDSSRERLLHRLHSVALVLSGLSASEAGRIYGDSPRAVAYWITRFKQDGLEGLHEETRPGRPSKLNQFQLKKLQIVLNKYAAKPKSVKAEILAEYISKEFGIVLTVRQCWRIVNRLTA
jgi:transposase